MVSAEGARQTGRHILLWDVLGERIVTHPRLWDHPARWAAGTLRLAVDIFEYETVVEATKRNENNH